MKSLDPVTIGVVAGLFALGLGAILYVSRIGLGATSRGLRTWLLGDLALVAVRFTNLVDMNGESGWSVGPPFVLTNALIAAGVAWHWRALCRHENPRSSALYNLMPGVAVGLAVGIGTWILTGPAQRVILHSTLACLFMMSIIATRNALRQFSGARLLAGAFTVGLAANVAMLTMALIGKGDAKAWGSANLLMGAIMTLFTVTAFLLWLQQELREHLVQVAITDALTGALNRHGLLPQLTRELSRAQRTGQPVSVVLCDLDHFKRINDQYGHSVGDEVLKGFAASSRKVLRCSDLFARWGGEEFLLVLPDTACRDAVAVVERLRLSQQSIAPGIPRVTMSAGVATATNASLDYDIDRIIATADARLYIAKETRDRVIFEDRDACSPQDSPGHGTDRDESSSPTEAVF